jgi:hypothetical protein
MGDPAAAQKDLEKARARQPGIDQEFLKFGETP